MMHRFTANISLLFCEHDFLDRIDAARACGFERVECHYPYDIPPGTLRERLAGAGVSMTGLNTPPGNREAGEFGLAGVPGREDEFRRAFDLAVRYATALGCPMIHVMAGVVAEEERGRALATYVANLREAARAVAGAGLTLLLEPINHRDRPGYLVSRSDEMAAILSEIGQPNVRMLFDVYHVQITEGDAIRRIERHHRQIAHVQVAAVPSRAEPDEGEIDLGAVLQALDSVGYGGLIGLEYNPRGRTEAGLERLRRTARARSQRA